MKIRVALLMALLVVPLASHAQAFKCRTPSGKVIVSNQGCFDGAQLEKITTAAPVTLDRQLQAAEVNNRMLNQLDGISQEKAAYNAKLQQQQAIQMQEDANNRARQGNENVRRQQEECAELATQKNMGRSQRAALAEICAKPEPNKERFNDCKERLAKSNNPSESAMIAAQCTGDPTAGVRVKEVSRPAPMVVPEAPAPLSIIKNCNGATCTDQTGQRYTTQAGKTVRSDGKRCYQQGNAMYCD